uniref:Uncharacterized protein n=1 Tax=Panagrolaimus sp. JU765 TaxID=591449 RepID=A0AC34QSW3_9BILA
MFELPVDETFDDESLLKFFMNHVTKYFSYIDFYFINDSQQKQLKEKFEKVIDDFNKTKGTPAIRLQLMKVVSKSRIYVCNQKSSYYNRYWLDQCIVLNGYRL